MCSLFCIVRILIEIDDLLECRSMPPLTWLILPRVITETPNKADNIVVQITAAGNRAWIYRGVVKSFENGIDPREGRKTHDGRPTRRN